ncbi:phage tail spike protein [Bacillus sp. TL12]|uniref:phage tail spike protein n=1 Tax=Bacillus sp. TL12 TaxID=2894756 RepID=UPI001F52142B|nr:phage tail spike protein [Bacillus sp. TL12]MCI0766065.1 phage tail protein [Bacillus sp. TL12]
MKNTLHILDFKTEATVGIIDGEDYRDDARKWDLENALDTFEFEVNEDIRDSFTLMSRNIIAKRVREGGYVTYFITEIDQGSDKRSKKIVALSEHVKLKGAKVILPQKLEQYTVAQLIDFCVKGTKWKRGVTEFASFRTINIDKPTNPLGLLQRLKSEFGMELRFRTVIKGNQIVARYVDAVKRVGSDSGKEITLGKDLIGIRRIENSQNIVTALVPLLDKGEDGILTIENVNDGKNFIYDFDAFKRWNQDGHHIYDIYTPQTEDQDMKPERLKQLGEMELKKRINASVIYEVDAQSLEKIFGLSHEAIRRGDTIRIKDTKFSPPLYLEARAIGGEECDTNPSQDKYYFGDYRELENVRSRLDKMYERILAMFAGKASKALLDALDKAVQETNETVKVVKEESASAKEIAEQVLENQDKFQTAIRDGAIPPTSDLIPGKTLWRDISKKPYMLYLWNGTEWDKIGINAPEEIGAVTTTEFEETANFITQSVQTVERKQTEQSEALSEAKGQLDVLSEQVKAKVSITEVSDYLDKIGTINDIRNSEWLKDAKYWVVNEEAWSLDTNKKFENANTMRFYAVGQPRKYYSIYSEFVTCAASEEFVASIYSFANDITTINHRAACEYEFWDDTSRFQKEAFEMKPDKNNEWQRFSGKVTIPENCKKIRLRIFVSENGLMWVAKPQLQRGSVASIHLPNPNDTINRDELIDKIAEKVALEDYNKKTESIDREIELAKEGISLSAKKDEVYTKKQADGEFAKDAYVKEMEGRIDITEENILNTVKKGGIISSINQTAEQITIDVKKLNINADTIVTWLTAKGINADIIKISGNKVTIDKNGITAKMADFLFEDLNGQKFSVIPRKNLIVDHCFAHITKGPLQNQMAPIVYSPFWRKFGNPYIENYAYDFGVEGMVNAMRINVADWIRFNLFNEVKRGKKYTYSAHFRCAILNGQKVTAAPSLRVIFGKYNGDTPVEGIRVLKQYPAPSTDGKIVRYAVTFTVPDDYDENNGFCYFDIFGGGELSKNQSCVVGGVQLVEGETPCMYNWDMSYEQMVNGIVPFSGFALGDVNNSYIYENGRNKIFNITSQGEGESLRVLGNTHSFISWWNASGRYAWMGLGQSGASRFTINTDRPVSFSNQVEINGINIGGGAYGSPGSMNYYNGAKGWGFYVHDGAWRYLNY